MYCKKEFQEVNATYKCTNVLKNILCGYFEMDREQTSMKINLSYYSMTDIFVFKWLVYPSYTSVMLKKSNYLSWTGRT